MDIIKHESIIMYKYGLIKKLGESVIFIATLLYQ